MSSSSGLQTTTAAARALGTNPRTVLRWLQAGLLKGVRTPGGHWRVARTDLDAFLERSRGEMTPVFRTGEPRILIVEDDPHHAVALGRLVRLVEPTADVEHASDGIAAGLALGILVPHVAIVDIELPGIDGIELIRQARRRTALREVCFLVVSGRVTPERILELRELGVRHILPKPVAPDRLPVMLSEILSQPAASLSPCSPEASRV